MKNLIDTLHQADAIQIDDHFIRYFYLEVEDAVEPDDVLLDVSTEDADGLWEWFITVKELEDAVFNAETNEWTLENLSTITCYTVKPLGDE